MSIYELRLLVDIKLLWHTMSGRPLRNSMLFIVNALKLCYLFILGNKILHQKHSVESLALGRKSELIPSQGNESTV